MRDDARVPAKRGDQNKPQYTDVYDVQLFGDVDRFTAASEFHVLMNANQNPSAKTNTELVHTNVLQESLLCLT